ncbi:hypothetical protein Vretifemale_17353, partial [Volvox reticuliferus]
PRSRPFSSIDCLVKALRPFSSAEASTFFDSDILFRAFFFAAIMASYSSRLSSFSSSLGDSSATGSGAAPSSTGASSEGLTSSPSGVSLTSSPSLPQLPRPAPWRFSVS